MARKFKKGDIGFEHSSILFHINTHCIIRNGTSQSPMKQVNDPMAKASGFRA